MADVEATASATLIPEPPAKMDEKEKEGDTPLTQDATRTTSTTDTAVAPIAVEVDAVAPAQYERG
eukprot:790675-Pleurochrysis_carterae.AAC.1